jgi:hypothetical protein
MGKKEEQKKEETEKIEPEVKEDGTVEVDIEEGQKPLSEPPKPQPQKDLDQSFRNKVYAQDRIIQKMQRELDELRASKQEPVHPQREPDDIDKIAQNDWKAGVRIVIQDELKQERQRITQEANEININQIMEKNSQFVLSRHSELNDANSEKSQIFQDILNTNPQWRSNPDGPLLVMYQMEEKLREKGYEVEPKTKEETEAERLARAKANSLPPSKPSTTNKFVLTKEQREFCDEHQIPYDEYAKTASKIGGGKGVELQ